MDETSEGLFPGLNTRLGPDEQRALMAEKKAVEE